MVDRLFLQIDKPSDVSLESSLQTGKKKGLDLFFQALRKTPQTHRNASAQPLLIVLQATSLAKNKNKCSINSNRPNHKVSLGSLHLSNSS